MGKIETHEIEGNRIKVCVHRKGATRAFGPGNEGLPHEYRLLDNLCWYRAAWVHASWVLVGHGRPHEALRLARSATAPDG